MSARKALDMQLANSGLDDRCPRNFCDFIREMNKARCLYNGWNCGAGRCAVVAYENHDYFAGSALLAYISGKRQGEV